MKILFFVLFLLPLSSQAQINRSAKELVKENVNAYLSNVFKNRNYKMVSLGQLKMFDTNDFGIAWSLDVETETTETRKVTDTTSKTVKQLYKFRFYLDRKFEVQKSECSFDAAKE